jgi:hypothetical protein
VTTANLLKYLPALAEFFPREIRMSWSTEEYQQAARTIDRQLLVAFDRLDGRTDWLLDEDDIPL